MKFARQSSLLISISIACGIFLLLFLLATTFSNSLAATYNQQPVPTPATTEAPPRDAPLQLSIANEVCEGCHGKPGINMALKNGEELDLYVNPEDHANSIHGELGYACVQCHTQVGDYPHPPFSAEDRRDATLKLNSACQRCHAYQFELNQDSVHTNASKAGIREAAVCADCHSAHSVQPIFDSKTNEILPEARLWIPQTCDQCHSAIYNKYRDSVHGSALTDEQNPDVPTCIDCHGVHNIPDPTTAEFRLKSPEICAKCHTDTSIMNKYGISTEVLDTYVADFHGTTQVLFEQLTPEQQFNKPVCYDCHGVHDIARADDPSKGLLVRENLLSRCQVCHPDASVNFPDAWLSHYIPSPEKYPAVFYVNLFYKFFIPTVLGGMAILVVLDFSRKIRHWLGTQDFISAFETKPRILQPEENNLGIKTEEEVQEAIIPVPASAEVSTETNFEPADEKDIGDE